MIDGIVMADSLYCGFQNPIGDRKLNDTSMALFHRFTRQAARGDKLMLLIHSAHVPNGYASTTETADDLIQTVAARRRATSVNVGDMNLLCVADVGSFHVQGFAGQRSHDHGNHLRHLDLWFKQLPIAHAQSVPAGR